MLPVADPWFSVDEVEPGIHLVTEPFCHRLVRANAFLIKGRGRDLLVDSGMGIASLRAALAPLLDQPLTVVATHAHVDHIGGHHEFADAEILVHPLEAEALARPAVPPGLGFDMFPPADRARLAEMGFNTSGLLIDAVPHSGYDPSAYRSTGIAATRLVDEGDVLDLGSRRFTVLHLPGHSPGGIGLWDAQHGTLIAGDTLYDGVLIDTLPGADRDAYVRSLRRLRELPVTIVHGGHKPSFGRERCRSLIDAYLQR